MITLRPKRMHSTRIHKGIRLMISLFHLIGVWHRRNTPTVKEISIKWFYCIYFTLFNLSLIVGAFTNDRRDKSIFLAEQSIGCAVLTVKFWLLTWKQDTIFNLLDRVCVFWIRNDDDSHRFNDKVRGFMKFLFVYSIATIVTCCLLTVVVPLIRSEKTLFMEIGFPLDYRNNEVAFWMATVFIFIGVYLALIPVMLAIMIWYLLFICSLRYKVLGSDLKNLGRTREAGNGKMISKQVERYFVEDLKISIDAHLHFRHLVGEVKSFFSPVFLIQFGASGLSICGSIFCLALDIGDNLMERLTYILLGLYFTTNLFMITHFGNEIKLTSDRLSYSQFEADWYDQSQSTKKFIIIFGEYLKQPQQLVIGKLYPLTLETFTRILKSAYSMFNILQNIQQ